MKYYKLIVIVGAEEAGDSEACAFLWTMKGFVEQRYLEGHDGVGLPRVMLYTNEVEELQARPVT